MAEHPHQPVFVAMMNLLWPRSGLDRQMFYDYWSGAHTQISSRLPGIHQYFQHHLDDQAGQRFPLADQLSSSSSSHPGFYGDAEITFASEPDLRDFAGSLNPLMQDEQNVFDKTISYQATGNNVHTLVDRTPDESPNGDLGTAERYMLYLQANTTLDPEAFRGGIVGDVGKSLAAHPDISKVRIRLLEPYDNDAVTLLAPNVSNYEMFTDQMQGCIEVVFPDPSARRSYADSPLAPQIAEALNDLARTVHTTRALRTFTVYNHGHITTAGLRTPQMAAQIAAIGATNQVGAEATRLMLNAHTQHDRSLAAKH